MSTTIYNRLSDQEKSEVGTYGCTVEQMRRAVEQSITFRFSGPAMMAASLMSDCQEIMAYNPSDDFNAREDVRQALNRAKWILFTYCMNTK